ncbi:hypothetical protein C8J56DRAFT_950802 [Mycena floridula]|nr:hypothetical protein C8J56DRAFT_950802 [Mycena floridula]
MVWVFWRQFKALFWKNWIVLSKHPFLNLLRCFILPVAFGLFLAVAQLFLLKPNNYGIGDPISVLPLQQQFDGSFALMWADGTDGSSSPSPDQIMSHITAGFNSAQLRAISKLGSPDDIPAACPQNFNGFSECFAAVAFTSIPANGNATNPVIYTILADSGLFHIDVVRHSSDYERRILPLQWAIDQAIIELQTGVQVPTPLEWPFTQETNQQQSTNTRLSFIRGIRTLLVLALFVCFVGVSYQLPGAVAAERANLVTTHMKAMGLQDSARVISWHLAISLVYLPAWVIVSLVWHFRIFSKTSVLLVLVVHVLLGLVLASWSFLVAAPFGKSPQLAAVSSTFLAILFAILALVLSKNAGNGLAFIFTILFPPGFYIFAIRAMCGFENHLLATDALHGDPDSSLRLLPLIIAALIDIFLWPWLAVLWERRMYDAPNPAKKSWFRKNNEIQHNVPDDVAISIRNLTKTFNTSLFKSKSGHVTAVQDLTLDIPKYGIFVLLGSNGAGKSTTLSILGGLAGKTSGSVRFAGGAHRPPGVVGLVPQKNVLFPELSCYQTLRVWKAVKWSKSSTQDEDLEQLLRDCDLSAKIHSNAGTLSGGQKRKLQLAIGLVGGSEVVLVDECTSGVDPLARRALWRTLTSFREERTIVFTTHFLDEADLLGDHIAILGAPGLLLAQGSPVSLKRDLGEGYTIQVSFAHTEEKSTIQSAELLQAIHYHASGAYTTLNSPYQVSYHLKSKDPAVVEKVLQMLDQEKVKYGVSSYDVLSTSIEDIFLNLMNKHEVPVDEEKIPSDESVSSGPVSLPSLALSSGRYVSPVNQALTIFHKRSLIVRRSWLTPLLAVLIAIAASTIPLIFIHGRKPSCVKQFQETIIAPLYLPLIGGDLGPQFASFLPPILQSPPGLLSTLGNSTAVLSVKDLPDNSTFVDTIKQNFLNLQMGGVSLDFNTGAALVAWEATAPGLNGPSMLNLASNLLYNHALNTSGKSDRTPTIIEPNLGSFPPVEAGTLFALKWVAFFGLAMAVYPAFFALYVTKERRSSVQAMQFSNGLANPSGLYLGHLLFDSMFTLFISTVITIVFATASDQFHGVGLFWLIMVLYGIAATLFAYCVSMMVASPLAAFAAIAGYQVIMFVLYLAGYLLTLTYAKTSDADNIITTIHFTLSLVSPVNSVIRAALVSVNMFSLLCTGDEPVTTASTGTIMRYGGPILYLIIYSFVLFALLVWVDSGATWPKFMTRRTKSKASNQVNEDVTAEARAVAESKDALRLLNVSKSFGHNKVVDNVSLGVASDTIFCLLGPNGAGKTTTFNAIRGEVIPESGDILIDGVSVIRDPRTTRFSLGVCPQFTAIDSQLTVREHLIIYGRLKGLLRGDQLHNNINAILEATRLNIYADRLANKLSGGNQRKLSLAIALIGNPPVVLIDEFSTGIDAKMKRDMWITLRNVAVGKAVVITTHSMEEASALAHKVGILAKRMLAVGTTESLSARYGTYEIHFSCRNREDVVKAQTLMSHIPNSRMADDVATRFEVPMESESGMSLSQLFHILSSQGEFAEYTVEKGTLESVFMKLIRQNQVDEEDSDRRKRWCF